MKYKKSFLLLLITLTSQAWAIKLAQYHPFKFEVLFTNPQCETYEYDQPIPNRDGELIYHRPTNVYCKEEDQARSREQRPHPHHKLESWIQDPNVSSIFLSALSFSNEDIMLALCNAQEQGKSITMILHENTNRALANRLEKCQGPEGKHPQIIYRGENREMNEGGLGIYHNKFILFEYDRFDHVRLVFGSGNLSSGTTLHHENWNFVTTNKRSHFAGIHFCMKEGVVHHSGSIKEYAKFIDQCRSEISAPPEEDVQVFIIPGEREFANEALKANIEKSSTLAMAAHRLSYHSLVQWIQKRLRAPVQVPMRLIVDDDIYWSGRFNRDFGLNALFEYFKVIALVKSGVEVRYFETNNNAGLLQHNKFIIFYDQDKKAHAVFTGAGNFTKSAFFNNFENFYMIQLPEVTEAYDKQYDHMWDELATPYQKMPLQLKFP